MIYYSLVFYIYCTSVTYRSLTKEYYMWNLKLHYIIQSVYVDILQHVKHL